MCAVKLTIRQMNGTFIFIVLDFFPMFSLFKSISLFPEMGPNVHTCT